MLENSNAQAMRCSQHPLFVQQCAATCRATTGAVIEGGEEERLPGDGVRRGSAAADDALDLRIDKLAARDVMARGRLWLATTFRTAATSSGTASARRRRCLDC